jgi:hypothetical protein
MSGLGTVSGCVQVGQCEARPANSGLTVNFSWQDGHLNEIMSNPCSTTKHDSLKLETLAYYRS